MALPTSKGAREYGRFRPTRHGEIAVAVTNEDEAEPLTLEVTASGDTELIPSPGVGENIIVKGFHFSNEGATKIVASLKAGTGGKKKFSACLAANGGSFDKNLVGRYWRLPLNTALVANLGAAGTVHFTVETEAGVEPAQEAATLTDSLAISESITKKAVELVISDAITFAEGEIEAPALNLADSLSIAESLLITGDRSKALADVLPIAEAVANALTLSLSDAQSLAASIEITYTPG